MRPSPTLAVIVALAVSTAAVTYTPHIKVVDGDTVDHGWWRWRVAGWDSPETGSRAGCAEERAMGKRAGERLRELLAACDGTGCKARLVSTGGKWDMKHYPPRRPGRLYLSDGREAGAVLASEGLARPYDGGKRETWCPASPSAPAATASPAAPSPASSP